MTRTPTHARRSFARAAGRTEELGALRGAYRAACEGAVRLLVLDGPSAAGKAALVDAWTAEHRAGPILRVDARRLPGAPGSPVERLLEAGLAELSPVRRSRHPARALLDDPAAPGPVADLMVAAERRLRLRDEVTRLLDEIGDANPAVVILDGMERAERSTIELLGELVHAPAPWARRPAVLLVALVDGAPAGALAELAGADAARTLTLRPLDRAGVRELLSSPDVVDAILELTGGLPELVERLVRGEALPRPGGHAEPTRDALEALALLDRPTTDAVLATVLDVSDAPPQGELARAGAVRAGAAWHLPPALRERVRATTDPDRARRLHRRAADALAEADPALAARHALRAGHLPTATEHALAGAARLVREHTTVDAADLLLEVAEAHDAIDAEAPDALRERLVELLWIAGDHDHAIAHAERRAAGRAMDAGAALQLGRLLAYAGRHADAVTHLERAVALADGEAQRAAEAALADALATSGDRERARALAEAVRRHTGERRLALDAENTLAKIELACGEVDEAEERLSASLAAAQDAGLPRQACQAFNNLAIVAMGRGELARATRDLERMLALAHTHGAVFYRGIAHKNLAVVQQLEGRWADALTHAELALSMLSGLGHRSLTARLSFNTADLHRSLGDPYRALRLCAHARQQAGDALEPAVDCEGLRVEAATHAELGHRAEARRAWTRALELAEALASPVAATDARLGLAELAVDEGAVGEARERMAATGEPRDARAGARRALLVARTAEGEARIPLARFAVHAARETGDPLLEQPARLELVRALAEGGLPGRAGEELAELRRREDELAARVPEPLRALFAERALSRRLAATERDLAEPPRRAAAQEGPGAADAMVGRSAGMRELRGWIERVGPSESTVLITGESGTGKELVAGALHAASPRREAPMLRVNCAALVDELLSSELFGHERGAFTGADRRKQGLFERADGGTLLLDEIGDVSPRMQAALLRVLQEGTFERVGGTRTLSVDVRVLAATHRDLRRRVDEGRFREDLFYRLSGITVRVPSLRERLEDLPALCRHLLAKIARETGGAPKTLAPDALERLARHGWPGNVRELENALRSVAVLTESGLLTAADFEQLAPRVSPSARPPASRASIGALAYARVKGGDGSIYDLRKRIERECIERALDESDGNISRAAEMLGMKRPRLSKLVNEWGLKK